MEGDMINTLILAIENAAMQWRRGDVKLVGTEKSPRLQLLAA